MRRYSALGVALVVVASACGWARPRFDAGRSGHNPIENRINAANVATLTPFFATTADPTASGFVVSRGHVYVAGSPMRVFDAAGQQGCSGTPRVCAPQWSLDGPGVADVIDSSVYGPSNNGTASGYDADGEMLCSGTPKVCTPLWNETIALPTSGSLDPDHTHFEVVRQSGHGAESAKIFGYNIRCAFICTPVWASILGTGLNGGVVAEPAVRDGALFTAYADRFLLGSDCWVTERWAQYGEIMDYYQRWLAELPRDIGNKIAHRNAERIFGITLLSK